MIWQIGLHPNPHSLPNIVIGIKPDLQSVGDDLAFSHTLQLSDGRHSHLQLWAGWVSLVSPWYKSLCWFGVTVSNTGEYSPSFLWLSHYKVYWCRTIWVSSTLLAYAFYLPCSPRLRDHCGRGEMIERLGCLFSGHSRTFTLVNWDSIHKIWERWSQTKPAWRGKAGTKFHPQLRSCFWWMIAAGRGRVRVFFFFFV